MLVYCSELKNPKQNACSHDEPDRRAHSDGREKQNEQTEDHGVGNQHAAVAKAGQNSRHGHLQAHGGNRLRHHEQAGLNGREPEANLVEERKDERDSADAQAGEEAAAHRRAEGANAKQAQSQQGKRGLRRMQSIARQQQDGNRQQPQNFAHAQRMFAEYLQHIRQQRDAGAKEDEADNIEGIGLFAVVRQMQIDHEQTDEADRKVHEKDDSPVKISDDQAAGDGSEHGTNQTRDGDEAHGADEFGLGKRPHQGEPAHGHHHGSAAALQDAARDQHMDVARYAAEKRPQGEEADRGREHPARSESIRHPAADRNEDREAQRVAGQHRLHAQRRHLERLRDGGHGRVQNRGVERLHEERDGDEPR